MIGSLSQRNTRKTRSVAHLLLVVAVAFTGLQLGTRSLRLALTQSGQSGQSGSTGTEEEEERSEAESAAEVALHSVRRSSGSTVRPPVTTRRVGLRGRPGDVVPAPGALDSRPLRTRLQI